MARFFFLLIATIICLTNKNCKTSFCNQNFYRFTKYSVLFNNYAFNNTHFTFYLQGENKLCESAITISSPKEIGIRIKTEQNNDTYLYENENIKYDISLESCIINQTIFENFDIFNLTNITSEYFHLTTKNIAIKIYFKPFMIKILKFDKTIITLNNNNSFLFEYNDDGSTISGIDISLNESKKYFFSGIGGISESFNIDDQIYKIYNSNSYPMQSSIPFITAHSVSQDQFGFFWANPSETYVRCLNNTIRFLSETGFVDLYIFIGKVNDIQKQYSLLTGKPFFPPFFSLGYHQSRKSYKNQKEVNDVMFNLERSGIPFDSIWLDANHLAYHSSFEYNEATFPEPKKLIGRILADDRYLIRLSSSHLPVDFNHNRFKEAYLNGYLVNQNNKSNIFTYNSISGQLAYLDFLNEDAREWWSNQYDYGVDISNTNVFYWNDKSEITIPKDAIHYKGIKNKEIHNIYGLLMSSATSEGLVKRNLQKTEKSHLRPYLVSLNIFSGSQKYAWSWTGDVDSTWENLQKSLAQVVASGVSVFPFIGCDVGGYNGSPSNELIVRWFQLASWTYPFFRQQSSSTLHEPYSFIDDAFTAISTAIADRYRHLLIWYNAARKSNLLGCPIIKPLWMYTPKFDIAHTITDQVILADTFMIAPILEKNQSIRYVIKPPGRWYCYPGGYELIESMNFLVSAMDIPVFLSGGKIAIVYQDIGSTAMETLQKENLDMFIALDENEEASGEVYLDDGVSYDYINGSYMHVFMSFKDGRLIIKHNGEFGLSDKEDEFFVKRLKVNNIHLFGLKDEPETNPKYETSFNGDKFSIKISNEPIHLVDSTNLKIIDSSSSKMTIATIIIGVILGLGIFVLLIIVPIFLLRREKMKEKPQDGEINKDIKNPILDSETP